MPSFYPEASVVFVPEIPPGSELTAGDFKASIIGRNDVGSRLREVHRNCWDLAKWRAFAAHHRLSRLIAIVDRNGYQLDGKVDDVMGVESLREKWQAFGWEVHEVDGHDPAALTALLRRLRADEARDRPACVIARTVKGKGVSFMETEPGWHLGYLAPQDAQAAIDEIMSREI